MAAADAEDITIWTAWVLGAVQGLTEFLPVSSSGHLTLGQSLAGLPDVEQNLAFDIFLHVATLLVVVVMLRKELIQIVRKHPRLLVLVVIGTVPGGVAGLFLDEHMAGLKTPLAVGVFWLVMGVALIAGEKTAGQGAKDLGAIGVRDAVLIGLAQMLALGAILASAVTLGYVFHQYPGLPESIPLSFPSLGGITRVDDKRELMTIPITGIGLLAVNLVLGFFLHAWERTVGYLLFVAAIGAQVMRPTPCR